MVCKHPVYMSMVYKYTLTIGKGWCVEKSPCVSQYGLQASTWSVASLSLLPTYTNNSILLSKINKTEVLHSIIQELSLFI